MKYRRYFYLRYNFPSIHFHAKMLYLHMFDIVDTVFSFERKLIVCSFLQKFLQRKESILHLICNAHVAFLLCGADIIVSPLSHTIDTQRISDVFHCGTNSLNALNRCWKVLSFSLRLQKTKEMIMRFFNNEL